MKEKRKSLKETQRLVTIGRDLKKADISSCCNAEIRQSGIYPRALYCGECDKQIIYEDQVVFKKKKAIMKTRRRHETRLNSYRLRTS